MKLNRILHKSSPFLTLVEVLFIYYIYITGDAQRWIASYLKERSQSVCISGKKSSSVPLTCGVPQGSVLGPDLFSDYSSPVASIIQSSKISVHCYTDDTQLYHAFEPGKNEEVVLHKLETCIEKTQELDEEEQTEIE